jgi:hypothetical protein
MGPAFYLCSSVPHLWLTILFLFLAQVAVRDSALPAATEKMQNTNRHEFARIFTNQT